MDISEAIELQKKFEVFNNYVAKRTDEPGNPRS